MDGVVYAAFGSHCDITPWQGWVFGVSTAGAVKARWVANATGNGAGIWQSGAGLTSDGPGTILLSTGNGGAPTTPTPGNTPAGEPRRVGRAPARAGRRLAEADRLLRALRRRRRSTTWDADFASGGVTGLPDEYFGTPALPHLAVAVGKEGYVYLLNRDNLGGIGQGPAGSDKVVQRHRPLRRRLVAPGRVAGRRRLGLHPDRLGRQQRRRLGGQPARLPVRPLGHGAAHALAAGDLPGRVRLRLERAGDHLRRHRPRARRSCGSCGRRTAGQRARSCARTTRSRSAASRCCAGARRSAPRRSSRRPAWAPGALYVGTRDGHVLGFGSPVTPPLTGSALAFPTTTIGDIEPKDADADRDRNAHALEPRHRARPVHARHALAGAARDADGRVRRSRCRSRSRRRRRASSARTMTATTSTGRRRTFALSGTGQAAERAARSHAAAGLLRRHDRRRRTSRARRRSATSAARR